MDVGAVGSGGSHVWKFEGEWSQQEGFFPAVEIQYSNLGLILGGWKT